jgi:hypothetical protein
MAELKYRTTGGKVFSDEAREDPDAVAAEHIRSKRTERMRAMEEIAGKSTRSYSPEKSKDDYLGIIKRFDYRYKDVISNPVLLNEVSIELQKKIGEAVVEGRALDIDSAVTEVGERVRGLAFGAPKNPDGGEYHREAGLDVGWQKQREESLEQIQGTRGKE